MIFCDCQLRFYNFCMKGGGKIYEFFRGKIAEQKKLRKLTNADIAQMTGYTKSAIAAFMCGARESEQVAKAIANALNIEL